MKRKIIAALALVLAFSASSEAEVRLPSILRDGMVLQRDEPITIWGWADAAEEVEIRWQDASYRTEVDGQGNGRSSYLNAAQEVHTLCGFQASH